MLPRVAARWPVTDWLTLRAGWDWVYDDSRWRETSGREELDDRETALDAREERLYKSEVKLENERAILGKAN